MSHDFDQCWWLWWIVYCLLELEILQTTYFAAFTLHWVWEGKVNIRWPKFALLNLSGCNQKIKNGKTSRFSRKFAWLYLQQKEPNTCVQSKEQVATSAQACFRNCTGNYNINLSDAIIKGHYLMPSPHISCSCVLESSPKQNKMEQLKMANVATYPVLG